MGQGTPMELVKIKKIIAEIQELPAKIDSTELAKNARQLLKKYAVLSEKIERNILIKATHYKELAKIRTEEFKAMRRTIKEKANSVLNATNTKKAQTEKVAKKTVKAEATKKTVKKASPKPKKATATKEGA